MSGKAIHTRLGAHTADGALRRADGRSAEARLMRETDEALINQYGGRERVSAARLFLIEATSLLRLRLSIYRTRAATGEDMPATADKHLSALAGHLRANLQVLGLDVAGEPEQTLETYIAANYASE